MDIRFKYSPTYEKSLGNETSKLSMQGMVETSNVIENMTEFWGAHGAEIEATLANITGLCFKSESIDCYLNSSRSCSSPLSVKIEDIGDMKDNLVHELIHVLLMENEESFIVKWNALFERFKDEPFVTRTHIVVHAIHMLLVERLCPTRLGFIKNYSQKPEYVRAWEIVEKEKAEKVVHSVFPRT